MHTIIMLISGFLLLAVFLRLGYRWSALNHAVLWFSGIWLIIAIVNMWVGIYHAGYSFAQEVPFFFLVFAPPVLLAIVLRYYLRTKPGKNPTL